MENATKPKRGGNGGKQRRRGKVTPRIAPQSEVLRVIPPPGSKFKGYETYRAQTSC